MQKRSDQKIETKRMILEAAIRLFGQRGILNTKTAAVAQEAGVAHGSVFLHFKTRSELVIAAVDQVAVHLSAKFSSLKECSNLKDFLTTHLEALKEWEDFYRWLIIESPLLEEEIGHRLVFLRSGISAYFRSALPKDPVNEPSFLFNTWMALLHYYLIERALFVKDKPFIEHGGEELVNRYLKLIHNKETR
ncbi:TetR/AcrR family transcriptional regulator [Estrella lausannensis]|uniref:TetR family transcriptional regulator n=1 Tax=Estrella lausannensis TaxID=483423 RepID=A0A0H5DNV7_9BACT|nr:TetR/AcrR family transcriptional regulator [Estrella lausannensis]CRX38002.1 TetR family transcriptional regulator [Estrella lausannensis]